MRWLLVFPLLVGSASLADEFADFGVPPQAELRQHELRGPTPLAVPGARTVTTGELRQKLRGSTLGERPLLIDVLGGTGHDSLPGTVWLPGAGRGGGFDDPIQERLGQTLRLLSGGDPAREIVFFCLSEQCWLSYNATLRAVRLGYTNVRWYRGGIEAWGAGGGALERPRPVWRPNG